MKSLVNTPKAILKTPPRFVHMCWLLLLLVSPTSFALADKVLAQSEQIIEVGLISIVVLISLLIFLLLILAVRLKLKGKKLNKQLELNASRESLLNAFSVGMLHLNQAGYVTYTNKVAAYFLGDKPQNIIGSALTSLFEESHLSAIESALTAKTHSTYQLNDAQRKRNIQLGISKASSSSLMQIEGAQSQVTHVVSMEDVSNFQSQLTGMQASLKLNNKLVETSQMGQLTVDLKESQFSCDETLAALIGSNKEALQGDIKEFERLIDSKGMYAWNQAIEQLKRNETVDFKCGLMIGEEHIVCRFFGLVTEFDAVSKSKSESVQPSKIHLIVQDLREHEKLKITARTAQEQARNLLSASPHSAYLLDEDGCLLDCNHGFESLFNLSKSQTKGQAFKSIDTIPESIRNLHPAKGEALSLMSSSSGNEHDVLLKDQKRRKLKVKLHAIKQELGAQVGLIGMIEDVTVLRQTEASLAEERRQFNKMLDQAPIAIARIDADDHVISANQTMIDSLGLSERELKKGSFYQLFNDPINSGKAAKQLHQTGRLRNFQASLRDKEGELHPSLLNVELFDKANQEFLCWISDISDQQYQQDKFDNLLLHSSMPMAVLADTGFVKLNPSACTFFGKQTDDEDEFIGMFPYSGELNQSEQTTAELKQKIEQVKQDGKAVSLVWNHQIENEVLPCQATYVPMFKGNDFDSILCIWMDLRAINKADEARLEAINLQQAAERLIVEKQKLLSNSQDQLASKVRSLADTQTELQAAKEDLSETQSDYSDLQLAHQDITDNLTQLQQDYTASRESLLESERVNTELESQLDQSTKRVQGLEKQRNNIADELQYSEQKFRKAQKELEESEENSQRLSKEHQLQQQKLEGFSQQISQLKHSIDDKDHQINQVSSQIDTLQSQLSSSGQTSEKLRQQLINQRKASEQAELQRRELEETFLTAQSELTNKARQVEHLQHEMSKFEEMSQQQKGDMEQQHAKLQQELEAKQVQLHDTEETLNETKRQSEKDKVEKNQQHKRMERLERELKEAESISVKQQHDIAQSNQRLQEQQQELQQQLILKQQKLQETEVILGEAKQQTQAEKAEKARQQQIFEQIKTELSEMEQQSIQQKQLLAQNDKQWQERQRDLTREVEEKQQQLQQTQQQLGENQRQADAERHARKEQQQKLEQLKVELSDVENRASKQREMMDGSDEQMRQHHAEIEQQKIQLQQALQQAKLQNDEMKGSLEGSLQELKKAESQVSETHSAEQRLQQELNDARNQALSLQQKLQQQEAQEQNLQQQLDEQQKKLKNSEQSIQTLESEQQQLTEKLTSVQQEYSETKQTLTTQDTNQSELQQQLKSLEQELSSSKKQLDDKEQALQSAQQKLESSQAVLEEQEGELVAAHKEELAQAKVEETVDTQEPLPEFATIDMPTSPEIWFDLLPYLQSNPPSGPLPVELKKLMNDFYLATTTIDIAVKQDSAKDILLETRKLAKLARKVNSDPLVDLATRLETDCQQGQVDSISIFWPNARQSIMKTLRVIYSHLHS